MDGDILGNLVLDALLEDEGREEDDGTSETVDTSSVGVRTRLWGFKDEEREDEC
jgi:hypothetical protein